jgi:uncharacterized cupin superfamily protein
MLNILPLSELAAHGLSLRSSGPLPCDHPLGSPPFGVEETLLTRNGTTARAGVWCADAYAEEIRNYPVDEIMSVVAGVVTITDASGERLVFGPGDTFVMLRGFTGTWAQEGPVTKTFVILGGAA